MKKTLVVGINLHGEIPLDKNSNAETRKVDSRYIIKLDAVSHGVPNISTFEQYNNLNEITEDFVNSNKWLNDPMKSERLFTDNYKNKMKDFLTKLKKKFREENKENVRGIEKLYSKNKKNVELNDHAENFIHNKDKMYTIQQFDTGDSITNKLFYKFTQAELDQLNITDDDLKDKGFNKIIIYNLENTDIFDLFGPEYTELTLFNLIDFLIGFGAENIIFIDMSCSVFHSENKISKRTIRTVVRKLMKSIKTGSGKTRHTKKSKNPSIDEIIYNLRV